MNPFGSLLNPQKADGPGYTGHVEDATTGLTYMQQRYYDSGIERFLSIDPVMTRQNGANFNRYAYAANNPFSAIDPDGRYVCKGSKELCTGIRKALRSIAQSARAQTGTLIKDARSAAVANFYGKEGVDNGVAVNDTDIEAYGKAETIGSTTTVSFNMSAIKSMSDRDTSAQNILDATALHEGSHGVDQRERLKRGLDPMTNSRKELLRGEYRAYRAEAAYHESLQVRSPWGFWEPGTGRNESDISEQAKASVETTCNLGKCEP
ncbi:RHS repeat-associated core domain-containing protein [Xanthomonas sacchari]|uniref:RHS repeat-associated core domain-containing protein n=1 Tax=Xanthomonas sacchari TaxID=56458 RepID=UPI0020C207A9|nr:RHS repeat-associated core domain-containing protein [Xanthomonas sacchari]